MSVLQLFDFQIIKLTLGNINEKQNSTSPCYKKNSNSLPTPREANVSMFVSFVPLNSNDYISLFNMRFFFKVHEIFKMLYLVLFETSVILAMLHK